MSVKTEGGGADQLSRGCHQKYREHSQDLMLSSLCSVADPVD